MIYGNPGLRSGEIDKKAIAESASVLAACLTAIARQMGGFEEEKWKEDFVSQCTVRRIEMVQIWEAKWRDICNGKRIFSDLQKAIKPRISVRKFKKRIMLEMRTARSDKLASSRKAL
jgi:hypothetical protein